MDEQDSETIDFNSIYKKFKEITKSISTAMKLVSGHCHQKALSSLPLFFVSSRFSGVMSILSECTYPCEPPGKRERQRVNSYLMSQGNLGLLYVDSEACWLLSAQRQLTVLHPAVSLWIKETCLRDYEWLMLLNAVVF